MAVNVYKDYLTHLNNLQKKPSRIKKSLSVLLIFFTLSLVTVVLAYFYIQKNILPKKLAGDYLKTAQNSVYQTSQTLNDVTAIYKVAGAKTELISAQNQATPSATGYSITIDDITKSISGLQSAKANIEIQKNALDSQFPPQHLRNLSLQITDYLASSQKILDYLNSRQIFYRQIQLALGPNLYLPTLESDNLWGKLSKQGILDYYQKTANQASKAVEKLAGINPPEEFKLYYSSQGKYLELVRDVSEKIVEILKSDESVDPNVPSQTEKAYQLFLGASLESKKLNSTLQTEKLKYQAQTEIFNQLAEVRLKEQAIEKNITDILESNKYGPSNSGNFLDQTLSRFTY